MLLHSLQLGLLPVPLLSNIKHSWIDKLMICKAKKVKTQMRIEMIPFMNRLVNKRVHEKID